MCLLGLSMEYLEAHEPRAGFINPHDGYDALDPLGEIASKAAHHVTRSHGWNTMVRVKYQQSVTRLNEV
jgi:hypothetical protein